MRKKKASRQKQSYSSTIEILNLVLSFGAIGSLLLFGIGLKDMDNYKNWLLLSSVLLVSGFLFSKLVFYLITVPLPEAKDYKNQKGMGLIFPLAFMICNIFLGCGVLLNESNSIDKECRPYTILEKSINGSRYKADYIFIDSGEGKERLSFGKAFNDIHEEGQSVNLCVVTGLLGFEYYKTK